jgi:hypothetical protein
MSRFLLSTPLADMQAWAARLMAQREPDYVIGDDYLRRWYVIPRNPWSNIYLHEFRRSDDDRALHDHPWDNASLVLYGEVDEITPEGTFRRSAGDRIERKAADAHRIELIGPFAVSLFITGPKVREWGFHCPSGWVHWEQFTAPGDSRLVGAGCGEMVA